MAHGRVPSFCADIAKLSQYFNNISDRLWNILAIYNISNEYLHNIF